LQDFYISLLKSRGLSGRHDPPSALSTPLLCTSSMYNIYIRGTVISDMIDHLLGLHDQSWSCSHGFFHDVRTPWDEQAFLWSREDYLSCHSPCLGRITAWVLRLNAHHSFRLEESICHQCLVIVPLCVRLSYYFSFFSAVYVHLQYLQVRNFQRRGHVEELSLCPIRREPLTF
jgi:hypothetical protein